MEQEAEYLRFQLDQLKRICVESKRERFEANCNQTRIEFDEYAAEAEKQDDILIKQTTPASELNQLITSVATVLGTICR